MESPEHPPQEPLELFEFEGCPYCRKVREALTELDLNYVCRPCGKGSANRGTVREKGWMEQFPFLVDPNTGTSMYESEDIIDYLSNTYGEGRSLVLRAVSPLNTVGAALPTLIRPSRGIHVRDDCGEREQPEVLLELYSFEGSPFCRRVRETLCELNLDYSVKNVGKGSPRREELEQRGGTIQVPYLIDSNTGTSMYESEDIIKYLEEQYA